MVRSAQRGPAVEGGQSAAVEYGTQAAQATGDDDPRHGILEEPAVGQRVDDEREQDGPQREAESLIASPNALDNHGRPGEESRYDSRPRTPSSAATVSGVVCDTNRVGEPLLERAWLSAG